MTPSRPYLIRGLYEWIVDNNATPYLVVDATKGAIVPQEYVEDGRIVLNIAVDAVQSLQLGNEAIEFKARFAGKARQIYAPIDAVVAIYARENGRGMVFTDDDLGDDDGGGSGDNTPPDKPTRDKPKLKLVK